MKLYLCEKPSQGRDIARNLGASKRGSGYIEGNGVTVTWARGHLLAQVNPDAYDPRYNAWNMATLPIAPSTWKMQVSKDDGAGEQFRVVKKLLSEADSVVIATDIDREGEAIGRELLDHCNYSGPVERLWLSALDDASIKAGLKKIRPGKDTESLYQAALARSRADWLVGMNLTRAFTLSGGGATLNVGRVQTPTLSLIVARDLEIENFKSKPFYSVEGEFSVAQGGLTAKWLTPADQSDDEGRCLDKSIADAVSQAVNGQQGEITKAETKKKTEKQPLPLDLSTLQQLCSKQFGFSADKTLKTAQALYETHKATTYPRSDCRYLPETQLAEVTQVMTAISKTNSQLATLVSGADTSIKTAMWNTKKVDDVGHNAIIPTLTPAKYSSMNADEQKTYDLIASYYIANFYSAFSYDQTVIELDVNGHRFRSNGKVPLHQGWHVVLKNNATKGELLPACKLGDDVQCQTASTTAKKTTPPARYTEGTLIADMKNVGREVTDPKWKKILKETSGIGTVATRANIIKALIDRDFLKVVKRNLISTEKGRELIKVLPEQFTSPLMTAVWEQQFDEIVKGQRVLDAFLNDQLTFVTALINKLRDGEIKVLKSASSDGSTVPCPTCGGAFVRRKGRNGMFWSCSDRECGTTANDKRGKPEAPRPKPKLTDKDCPKCDGKLREMQTADKRTFLSCQNYPKCKHSEWPEDKSALTDKDCPKCGQGKLAKRKSKKGNEFLSCQRYPECDHAEWPESDTPPAEKTGKTCPQCKKGELVKRTARTGKNKGKQFTACNAYPDCKYSE